MKKYLALFTFSAFCLGICFLLVLFDNWIFNLNSFLFCLGVVLSGVIFVCYNNTMNTEKNGSYQKVFAKQPGWFVKRISTFLTGLFILSWFFIIFMFLINYKTIGIHEVNYLTNPIWIILMTSILVLYVYCWKYQRYWKPGMKRLVKVNGKWYSHGDLVKTNPLRSDDIEFFDLIRSVKVTCFIKHDGEWHFVKVILPVHLIPEDQKETDDTGDIDELIIKGWLLRIRQLLCKSSLGYGIANSESFVVEYIRNLNCSIFTNPIIVDFKPADSRSIPFGFGKNVTNLGDDMKIIDEEIDFIEYDAKKAYFEIIEEL